MVDATRCQCTASRFRDATSLGLQLMRNTLASRPRRDPSSAAVRPPQGKADGTARRPPESISTKGARTLGRYSGKQKTNRNISPGIQHTPRGVIPPRRIDRCSDHSAHIRPLKRESVRVKTRRQRPSDWYDAPSFSIGSSGSCPRQSLWFSSCSAQDVQTTDWFPV